MTAAARRIASLPAMDQSPASPAPAASPPLVARLPAVVPDAPDFLAAAFLAVLLLAAVFLAALFLAADFLLAVFFAAAFLPAGFFLAAVFLPAFFFVAAFLAGAFFAADFFLRAPFLAGASSSSLSAYSSVTVAGSRSLGMLARRPASVT